MTEALVAPELVARVQVRVAAALHRKPAKEAELAAILAGLAEHSPALRELCGEVAQVLAQRGAEARELYVAAARLAVKAPQVDWLIQSLSRDEPPLASLSVACACSTPELRAPLARVAASRRPGLAFAAEFARAVRGDASNGTLESVAPRIKESARLALCCHVLAPLLDVSSLPAMVGPGLNILRSAERHLGRWLLLAELAVRSGDRSAALEAQARAEDGHSSSRSGWRFVAWALEAKGTRPPPVRPTTEVMARLSARPAAEPDPSFVFRLAEEAAAEAEPLLEFLAKRLNDATSIRSALYLALRYGRTEFVPKLASVAGDPRREALRGLAAAALHDLGDISFSQRLAKDLLDSKKLSTAAWAGLLTAQTPEPLVNEQRFRRLQLGWLD